MLIIRQAQIDVLAQFRLREFEDRVLEHLRHWMPRHSLLLGDEPMRRVVQHGLRKARRYGLDSECTVIGYVDLMCLLGSGFDTDPLLPWAAPILTEAARGDPVERGDRLYDAAWEYIDRIVADYRGQDGKPLTERLVLLLREGRVTPREELAAAAFPAFGEGLQRTLATYFPAKAAAVGGAQIAALAQRARRRAHQHRLSGQRGILLLAVLMFILGDGFDTDPLLPWVSPILTADADEASRVDRLFASGTENLRRWWDMERTNTGH